MKSFHSLGPPPTKYKKTEVHMLNLQILPVHENRLQLHALKCDLAKCLLRYSVSST